MCLYRGSCVHGNETSGSIKGGEFIDHRIYHQILEKELVFFLVTVTRSDQLSDCSTSSYVCKQ